MKKIVASVLSFVTLLSLCSCAPKSNDNTVTKMINSISGNDIIEFKNLAEDFFDESNGDETYSEFCELFEEVNLDSVEYLGDDCDVVYNGLLWTYIFTYFYEDDMETFVEDSSTVISMMEQYKSHFRYQEDENKYCYATVYFQSLNHPEELARYYFDALSLYYLAADSMEKEEIIYALYMENAVELNEFYLNLQFFTKGSSVETIIDSGDGQTNIDNISDIVNCSDNLLGSALGEETMGFYEANPIVSERDKGDIFVFEAPSYTIAYYGSPVYAYSIHDNLLGTVLYAKTRDVADLEYYTYTTILF